MLGRFNPFCSQQMEKACEIELQQLLEEKHGKHYLHFA